MNDMDSGEKCTLNKSRSDAKEGWVAYTPGGFAAIERDLNRMENRTKSNFMQLNIVLHLGRHNPLGIYAIVMEK